MIECKFLSVTYGAKCVLRDISFTLQKGELVSVIGKNASGKTTLLRALMGSLKNATGEVFVDGLPRASYKPNALAKKISYLPQHTVTSPLTVLDTVLMGRLPHLSYPRIYRECDREATRSAISKMRLDAFSDARVSELSGGYRQRVALASALATESDYLFLDEPSTFLDMESTLSFLSTLRSLAKEGRGILAVLHDLPLALRFADRLLVLDGTRLVAFDTPDALYSSGILESVFGVSLGRIETSSGYAYYIK